MSCTQKLRSIILITALVPLHLCAMDVIGGETQAQLDLTPQYTTKLTSLPPLVTAVMTNDRKEAEQILEEGVDLNTKNDALLSAVNNNLELIKLLVDYGVTINQPNDLILVTAITNHHIEIIQFLVDHGTQITSYVLGHTILQIVSDLEKRNAKKAEIAAAAQHASNALTLELKRAQLAYQQSMDILKLLMMHTADINTRNGALHQAIAYSSNNMELFSVLLSYGADANAIFQHAITTGNYPLVELLLKHKADVSRNDDNPLFLAINQNDPTMVKLLIKHGANVHARGDSLLQEAIQTNKPEVVHELLLAWKKPVPELIELPDFVGPIPNLVTLWRHVGSWKYKKRFKNAYILPLVTLLDDQATAFITDPQRHINNLKKQNRLFEMYPDKATEPDAQGRATVLMWAVALGETGIVKQIINEANAQLSKTDFAQYLRQADRNGNTALAYAFYGGNGELIRLLAQYMIPLWYKLNLWDNIDDVTQAVTDTGQMELLGRLITEKATDASFIP